MVTAAAWCKSRCSAFIFLQVKWIIVFEVFFIDWTTSLSNLWRKKKTLFSYERVSFCLKWLPRVRRLSSASPLQLLHGIRCSVMSSALKKAHNQNTPLLPQENVHLMFVTFVTSIIISDSCQKVCEKWLCRAKKVVVEELNLVVSLTFSTFIHLTL